MSTPKKIPTVAKVQEMIDNYDLPTNINLIDTTNKKYTIKPSLLPTASIIDTIYPINSIFTTTLATQNQQHYILAQLGNIYLHHQMEFTCGSEQDKKYCFIFLT